MKEHLEEDIKCFGGEISGRVISPAHPHIFTVNGKAEKLDEDRRNIFHSMTDILLYLMKRY